MKTPTYEEASLRVIRGALYLDSVSPGWREKIDLRTLDIGLSCRCVLGQVYGHYFSHARMMQDRGLDPFDHGFGAHMGEGDETYAILQRAWLNYLSPIEEPDYTPAPRISG